MRIVTAKKAAASKSNNSSTLPIVAAMITSEKAQLHRRADYCRIGSHRALLPLFTAKQRSGFHGECALAPAKTGQWNVQSPSPQTALALPANRDRHVLLGSFDC